MKKLIRGSKPHFQVRAFAPMAAKCSRINGFGLIEFVCAVAIIGIILVLGIWQYFKITESVKINEAKKHSFRLTAAAKIFEMDTGRTPEKLECLVEFSGIPNWHGPYINMEKFIDPWGEPYFVIFSDDEILVTCSNLQLRLEKTVP